MGSPGSTGKELGNPGYVASSIVDSNKTSQYQRNLIDQGVKKILDKGGSSDSAGAYAQRETAKIIAINEKKGLIPGNPVRVAGNSTAKLHPDNKPAIRNT